jgi:hypothetical protein
MLTKLTVIDHNSPRFGLGCWGLEDGGWPTQMTPTVRDPREEEIILMSDEEREIV